MPVRFAGRRAACLAHVGMHAGTKRDKFAYVRTHALGNADDDFKLTLHAGKVSGFLEELEIAAGVGESAGFLVSRCDRQYYFGPFVFGGQVFFMGNGVLEYGQLNPQETQSVYQELAEIGIIYVW